MHAAAGPEVREIPQDDEGSTGRGAPTHHGRTGDDAEPAEHGQLPSPVAAHLDPELVDLAHRESCQPGGELARQEVLGGGDRLRQQRHEHDDGHAAGHGERRVEGVPGLEKAPAHELGDDHDGEEAQTVEAVGGHGAEQCRARRAPQRGRRRA